MEQNYLAFPVRILYLVVLFFVSSHVSTQTITCSTNGYKTLYIRFTELDAWVKENNISDAWSLTVNFIRSRTAVRNELINASTAVLRNRNSWAFHENVYDVDPGDTYFFQVSGVTKAGQVKTLSRFRYPNNTKPFDTWNTGMEFRSAQDCFAYPDTDYVIKIGCKSLEILSVDKDFVHALEAPTMTNVFTVNGRVINYTQTSFVLRKYKGDVLTQHKDNTVCLQVFRNWQKVIVCEKATTACPKHESFCTMNVIAYILAAVFGGLLFVVLVTHTAIKKRGKTTNKKLHYKQAIVIPRRPPGPLPQSPFTEKEHGYDETSPMNAS